jgi:AraC-like DNA-binding protein
MPALRVRPNALALRPFIRSLSFQESALPPAFERMLPTGQVHLLVNAFEDEFRLYDTAGRLAVRTGGSVLLGARAKPAIIDTREQRALIRIDFKLGGAAAFFRAPLVEAQDEFVNLHELWGKEGAVIRERVLEGRTPQQKLALLEDVLLKRLADSDGGDPAIAEAGRLLERGSSVSAIQSELGLLPKTLVRRFHQYVGLSPKRYGRVRRLQRVLRAVNSGRPFDWAEIAAAHGYTDQAHLIHDFRELTGVSPSGYRPNAAGVQNHIPLEL